MINMPKGNMPVSDPNLSRINEKLYKNKVETIIEKFDNKDKFDLVEINYRPDLSWKLLHDIIFIVPKDENKLEDEIYIEWLDLLEDKTVDDFDEYKDIIANMSISSNQADIINKVERYFKEIKSFNTKEKRDEEFGTFYDKKGKTYNSSNFEKDLVEISQLAKEVVIRENKRENLKRELEISSSIIKDKFVSQEIEEGEIIGNRLILIAKYISRGDVLKEESVKRAVLRGLESGKQEVKNEQADFSDRIYSYVYYNYLKPEEQYRKYTLRIIMGVLLLIFLIYRLVIR